MDGDPENTAFPWLNPEFATELAKVAVGESDIWFDPRDKRFADEDWKDQPYFRQIAQTYKLFEDWIGQMGESVDGDWAEKARARMMANIVAAAASPTNYLMTNPVALRRAIETGGLSVLHGQMNMMRDLARGGLPRSGDRTKFPLGEKVAFSEGAVVYREEIFELLHYKPLTPRVHSVPLLMVPPQINRHYLFDLARERSMVEFALRQGFQVFLMVWRNPKSDLGHGEWGLTDYLDAHDKATEVVKAISHSDKLNYLGLCAGGMSTAYMLARQKARGDETAASATFIVTMLSGDYPNVIGMLDTKAARAQLEAEAEARHVIPGSALRTLFAFLRPNDLVYNYMVSGWLMGEDPAPFDVLAWNDDATGASAKYALDTQRIVIDKTHFPEILEYLPKVTTDSFQVTGYTDHITPWRACYSTSQMLGGEKEFICVKSGHIQTVVDAPRGSRYPHWHGRPTAPDPDSWLKTAEVVDGSWWPAWAEWLAAHSGADKPARATLGNKQYPPIEPAPGLYVRT